MSVIHSESTLNGLKSIPAQIIDGKSMDDDLLVKLKQDTEMLNLSFDDCPPEEIVITTKKLPHSVEELDSDKILELVSLSQVSNRKIVASDETWKCLFCPEVLTSPNRLSLHIKSRHKETLSLKEELLGTKSKPMYECKLCHLKAKTTQQLVKHTLKSHGHEITKGNNDAVKDPRRCGMCQKLCSGAQGLRCHLYWTHRKDASDLNNEEFHNFVQAQLNCSAQIRDCEMGYKKSRKTVEEVVAEIKGQKRLKCTLAKVLATRRRKCLNSTTAEALELSTYESFHCNECQLSFIDSDLIKRHQDLRHTNIQCPLCYEWCKGRIGLETHDDNVHFGEVKFQLNFSANMKKK